MDSSPSFIVRNAQEADAPKLAAFFKQVYGAQTAFQDESFLASFFHSHQADKEPLSYSVIALDDKDNIIAHYGGVQYPFQLCGEVVSAVWGTNGYTLKEWRDSGVFSAIIRFICEHYEFNGGIGIPHHAPPFYQRFGYHVFHKDRFDRYLMSLSETSYQAVQEIGQNVASAKSLAPINDRERKQSEQCILLTAENIGDYRLDLPNYNELTTSVRDTPFLQWRIFDNPNIDYSTYAFVEGDSIKAYMVLREEALAPKGWKISRIIDLYGSEEGVVELLSKAQSHARAEEAIFLDFYVFGSLFEKELLAAGFHQLCGEEASLFPSMTSPMEHRENQEYVIMQSSRLHEKVHQLQKKDVYLTRIDSDRDRIARIDQIKNR